VKPCEPCKWQVLSLPVGGKKHFSSASRAILLATPISLPAGAPSITRPKYRASRGSVPGEWCKLRRGSGRRRTPSKRLDQAARQVARGAGKQIIWYFAEDAAATTFAEALAQAGITGTKVLVVAAAAP
jgi:hypothetical protein